MAKHHAIAATITAAALFSLVLVSNLTVISASQQEERISYTVYGEQRIAAESSVLEDSAAFGVLGQVQTYLSATTLPCASAEQAAWAGVSGFNTTRMSQNVSAEASLVGLVALDASDNMSALGPFAGSAPGRMDLETRVLSAGAYGSVVSFSKDEVHRLNLHVFLGAMSQVCSSISDDIAGALQGPSPTNCSGSSVSGSVSASIEAATSRASAAGFASRVVLSVSQAQACDVLIDVEVFQHGIPGPLGTFTASESGSRTVEVPVSSLQQRA